MDTIQTLQTDTVSDTYTEQPPKDTAKHSAFDIFMMGIAGVFAFVVLYILVTKIMTVIIKNKEVNKNNEDE